MKVSDALTAFNIAKRDAETLLLHCLGRTDRAWLFAHDTDDLAVEDLKQYSALCRERDPMGEPSRKSNLTPCNGHEIKQPRIRPPSNSAS